jgi:pSer/pThr/pTyr-binding forkhead associated (FHA) protein
VIGRAPEADVILPDTFVSSRHARVTAETGGVVVEDLGSTNGTLVGDREVEGSLFVAPGEKLTIGDTVFVLEYR